MCSTAEYYPTMPYTVNGLPINKGANIMLGKRSLTADEIERFSETARAITTLSVVRVPRKTRRPGADVLLVLRLGQTSEYLSFSADHRDLREAFRLASDQLDEWFGP